MSMQTRTSAKWPVYDDEILIKLAYIFYIYTVSSDINIYAIKTYQNKTLKGSYFIGYSLLL